MMRSDEHSGVSGGGPGFRSPNIPVAGGPLTLCLTRLTQQDIASKTLKHLASEYPHALRLDSSSSPVESDTYAVVTDDEATRSEFGAMLLTPRQACALAGVYLREGLGIFPDLYDCAQGADLVVDSLLWYDDVVTNLLPRFMAWREMMCGGDGQRSAGASFATGFSVRLQHALRARDRVAMNSFFLPGAIRGYEISFYFDSFLTQVYGALDALALAVNEQLQIHHPQKDVSLFSKQFRKQIREHYAVTRPEPLGGWSEISFLKSVTQLRNCIHREHGEPSFASESGCEHTISYKPLSSDSLQSLPKHLPHGIHATANGEIEVKAWTCASFVLRQTMSLADSMMADAAPSAVNKIDQGHWDDFRSLMLGLACEPIR